MAVAGMDQSSGAFPLHRLATIPIRAYLTESKSILASILGTGKDFCDIGT
jgi:hypothetical protein